MSGDVVTVTVSGPTGSGKSAICGEIEIALCAIGVPVTWNDQGEKNLTHANWQRALDLYQPHVVIVEKNQPRDFATETETAWLIEDASSSTSRPRYFSASGPDDAPAFSEDPLQALRFARRDDAEAFARMSSGAGWRVEARIAEHAFG